ncbi:MAG: TRAP transporter small permease subunit [Rhodobacteraceae bacterium]|nr:TRAP transporter small permease subunit [Paracoccaceae bacterium]
MTTQTSQIADDAVVDLPRGLAKFRRLLHIIGKIEITAAICALVFVVALSATQTILRYLFATSMWWTQEVVEISILACYFFGISYVFKTRQYILIEFLSSKGSIKFQLALYMLAQIFAIIFTGLITWMFYLFLPTLINMRSTILGWPGWLGPLPLVIASIMMVLTSIYYFLFGLWAFGQEWDETSLDGVERHALTNIPEVEIE